MKAGLGIHIHTDSFVLRLSEKKEKLTLDTHILKKITQDHGKLRSLCAAAHTGLPGAFHL